MRLAGRSGRFRRTIERRQLVNLMVGEIPEPEQGPIPDSDYSSTDEMFNLTSGLQELGQFVMERDPARISVSFGVPTIVPCGGTETITVSRISAVGESTRTFGQTLWVTSSLMWFSTPRTKHSWTSASKSVRFRVACRLISRLRSRLRPLANSTRRLLHRARSPRPHHCLRHQRGRRLRGPRRPSRSIAQFAWMNLSNTTCASH